MKYVQKLLRYVHDSLRLFMDNSTNTGMLIAEKCLPFGMPNSRETPIYMLKVRVESMDSNGRIKMIGPSGQTKIFK